MSPSETTATYPVVMLRHRRTLADTIRYDGTEHCRMAIHDWIVGNGGNCELRPDGGLLVVTRHRTVFVRPGQWVLHATTGHGEAEFWPVDADVVDFRYEPAGGHDHGAVLTRDQTDSIGRWVEDVRRLVIDRGPAGDGIMMGELERALDVVGQLVASVESLR
jgi:hypothetical protein